MVETKNILKITQRMMMKNLMGLQYSRQGLMYIVVGSLLLLGALGILNWSFAWIIIAFGLIVYGLILWGADNLVKCKVSPRKKPMEMYR